MHHKKPKPITFFQNSYKKIICPVLTGNKLLYPKFINELEYFEFLENEDDRKRNIFYADEEKRKKVLLKSNSNGWIKKLNLHAYVEKFKLSNLNRIEQLMNKTNQMNLKTRRLSSKEICKWNKSRENMMYSFKLKDNLSLGVAIRNIGKARADSTVSYTKCDG